MPITIELMKKRDKRENDLGTELSRVNSLKDAIVYQTSQFDKSLAKYQKWKADNKVEGIKY